LVAGITDGGLPRLAFLSFHPVKAKARRDQTNEAGFRAKQSAGTRNSGMASASVANKILPKETLGIGELIE
jgi:hypothetical protein